MCSNFSTHLKQLTINALVFHCHERRLSRISRLVAAKICCIRTRHLQSNAVLSTNAAFMVYKCVLGIINICIVPYTLVPSFWFTTLVQC